MVDPFTQDSADRDEMHTAKLKIRARILELRKTLQFDRESANQRIHQNLNEIPEFQKAKVLYLYVGKSTTAEVLTNNIITDRLTAGKRVFLPKTLVQAHDLRFGEIHEFPRDTVIGAFNVLEPRAGCYPEHPPEPSCIIIPGVAFDARGNRLGYGQGYYDVFLARLKGRVPIIALAYDLQIIPEELPHNHHDIPLDILVTESRVMRFSQD